MSSSPLSARTPVTKRKFYLVRKLQKNRIPIAGIQRETGLGATSIRDIRRVKTWPAWNMAKDARNAARRRKSNATATLAPQNPAPVKLPEPPFALASDFNAAVTTIKNDQADLHKRVSRVRGVIYYPDGVNRITELQRKVEDLKAFQQNVRRSGILNRLINRAAKKHAQRQFKDR